VPLDHLWATWRSNYVNGVADSRVSVGPDDVAGRSLFERILDADGSDDEKFIVHRGDSCFVILNRFPYTVGHLMVLPNRAVASLVDLDDSEHDELWRLVRHAEGALRGATRCDGINVGLNLGAAAGGSQSDHLHVHCVPRWVGDTNFIGIAAETRVLPISLDDAYAQLLAVW